MQNGGYKSPAPRNVDGYVDKSSIPQTPGHDSSSIRIERETVCVSEEREREDKPTESRQYVHRLPSPLPQVPVSLALFLFLFLNSRLQVPLIYRIVVYETTVRPKETRPPAKQWLYCI